MSNMREVHHLSLLLPGAGTVTAEVMVWRRNGRVMKTHLGVCTHADGNDLTPEDKERVRELLPPIR